jgi:hypothetical protein
MTNNSRMTDLRRVMRETGKDLVALGPGSHMQWLVGFHPHADERPCLLLVGLEKETFLMPVLNAEGSRESTEIEFHTWADEDGPDAALASALAAIDATEARQVVLDETMRADFALLLLGALPDATHAFTAETLGALRMRKDAGEYDRLKMNAGIADRAMQKAFATIRPGMTETELANAIKDHFASEGATPAFWIVGAGSNGAFPHHQTGNRQLAEGDAIVIDIGGRKAGFPSDITRMAVVGRPPEGYGQIHTIVEKAVQAAPIVATAGRRPCAPLGPASGRAKSTRRHATSSPMPAMASISSTARATAWASTAMSRPTLRPPPTRCWRKGWCSRSNPESTFPAASGSGSRTSSSCAPMAPRFCLRCRGISTSCGREPDGRAGRGHDYAQRHPGEPRRRRR